MAKKVICANCGKEFKRGIPWHWVAKAVEPTRWDLFKAFLRGKPHVPVKKEYREHITCPQPLTENYQAGDENTLEFENL